ncbi:hypothetical protein LCGC14_2882390, partial [marine sediment metagenome]
MTDQHITNEALYAATDWFVKLTSGDETEQDKRNWQAWINDDPTHELAWQKIEAVTRQFSGLDSQASSVVLNRKQSDL